MRKTPLQRKTPLKSGSSLARSTPMPKGTKPINKENPERKARVSKQRKAKRNSPEHRAAKKLAMERAASVCECGCQRPMDMHGEPSWPGYPEFHHDSYRDGKVRGRMMRRECHQRVERIHFGYRHATRRAAA